MKVNIYCDEGSINSARYMLIGGLWVPWETEQSMRDALKSVRNSHRLTAEMKWTKISKSKLGAYLDYVDVFWKFPQVRFNCIVIDTHELDYKKFHRGDKELGFYKFYFLLISRNLDPENTYWLYTDARNNRKSSRLDVLSLVTNNWWQKKANVKPLRKIEPRASHGEEFIQLADVLLGAVAYSWNQRIGSAPKLQVVNHLTHTMNWPTLRISTNQNSPKINIWHWQSNQNK